MQVCVSQPKVIVRIVTGPKRDAIRTVASESDRPEESKTNVVARPWAHGLNYRATAQGRVMVVGKTCY